MGNYRKLMAWKHAHELAVRCKRVVDMFPSTEQYRLATQLRSAAFGAALNIAEGAGRASAADFRRFLIMARASLEEARAALHLARDCGYLKPDSFGDLDALADEAARTLFGLIRAVERALSEARDASLPFL